MIQDLDLTGIPEAIQNHLQVISKNILFDDVDRKAGNGYVFFGRNKVTGIGVTVKYYYWGGEAHLHAEPAQLSQIRAANVLQILDAGEIDGEWAYFLTPTCANGDLDDLLDGETLGLREGIVAVSSCSMMWSIATHKAAILQVKLPLSNIAFIVASSNEPGELSKLPLSKKEMRGSLRWNRNWGGIVNTASNEQAGKWSIRSQSSPNFFINKKCNIITFYQYAIMFEFQFCLAGYCCWIIVSIYC
jgi:hypothetical protein